MISELTISGIGVAIISGLALLVLLALLALLALQETTTRHEEEILKNKEEIKSLKDLIIVENFFFEKGIDEDNKSKELLKSEAVKFRKYVKHPEWGWFVEICYTTKKEAEIFKDAIKAWEEEIKKPYKKI